MSRAELLACSGLNFMEVYTHSILGVVAEKYMCSVVHYALLVGGSVNFSHCSVLAVAAVMAKGIDKI